MKAFPFSRFIVNDKSMIPSYFPGDRVLTFNWKTPKKNNVIVFKGDGRFLIKRVKRIDGENFICRGDNRIYSKTYYKVEPECIRGKVILKY